MTCIAIREGLNGKPVAWRERVGHGCLCWLWQPTPGFASIGGRLFARPTGMSGDGGTA
jgi:hypothetical protein